VGRRAAAVAAAGRYVWVANADDGTVTRLEAASGRAVEISTRGSPVAVAPNGKSILLLRRRERADGRSDPLWPKTLPRATTR
jgi:hypothetical protein